MLTNVYHRLIQVQMVWFRSSRQEVLSKEGVLWNFTKFAGKNLCQRLFFSKAAGPRPGTLLKKRLWHRCVPVNLVKFLRTPFFREHLWWLLLLLTTNSIILTLSFEAFPSKVSQKTRDKLQCSAFINNFEREWPISSHDNHKDFWKVPTWFYYYNQ